MKKVRDLVIYRSDEHYAAHPTVCENSAGELLVAFRRQPNRRKFEGLRNLHVDVDSHCALVRSADRGETWSGAEVIHHRPRAGDNDPCLNVLSDGHILMTFFNWELVDADTREEAGGPPFTLDYHRTQEKNPWPGVFKMTGARLMHSDDGGKTFKGEREVRVPEEYFGGRCAIQGKAAELPDGRVLLPVYAGTGLGEPLCSLALESSDRGGTFSFAGEVAVNPERGGGGFDENTLIATPGGDVVSFIEPSGDQAGALWVSRSSDSGKTWRFERVKGVRGVPQKAVRLSDGRVLLVYGYRFSPAYGVRARLLDPECRRIAEAEEIVIRDDGAGPDLGYPNAVEIAPGRILVVYYFTNEVSDCHIEGSILEG